MRNSCLDNSQYYCNRLQIWSNGSVFPLKSNINCVNGLGGVLIGLKHRCLTFGKDNTIIVAFWYKRFSQNRLLEIGTYGKPMISNPDRILSNRLSTKTTRSCKSHRKKLTDFLVDENKKRLLPISKDVDNIVICKFAF